MDKTLRTIIGIRDQLANVEVAGNGVPIGETAMAECVLDEIAEIAVKIRANLQYGSNHPRQHKALIRRVRKALGYTYP